MIQNNITPSQNLLNYIYINHKGRANGIKEYDLSKELSMSERTIRAICSSLRKSGEFILYGDTGIFYGDIEEVRECITIQLKGRIKDVSEQITGLEQGITRELQKQNRVARQLDLIT